MLRSSGALSCFMKKRIEEGRFTEGAHGLGTVTEAMVGKRAKEIALINGHPQVLSTDWDQARRELTGRERLVPETTREELLPEESRDVAYAPPESRVPAVPAPDEQTFAEKLVEEGVQEAEHEQMVQASREALKQDRKNTDHD